MSLVLRSEIGRRLSISEMDGNFTYLQQLALSGTTSHGTVSVYTEITYSELYTSIQSSSLNPGNYYLITDYKTCYDQPDFNSERNAITVGNYKESDLHPIVVLATSINTLAVDAYQPDYPNDTIKYDFSWTQSEVTGGTAYGRITERIDEYGNRTDYDHRNILFKRYNQYYYNLENAQNGTVQIADTGIVTGTNSNFTSLSVGNKVIVPDYNNYLFYKIVSIDSDTIMTITGSIIPNTDPELKLYTANTNGYVSYYADNTDPNDYEENYTFHEIIAYNNYFGNYANQRYWEEFNFILPNNVMKGGACVNNKFGDMCYNNTFDDDCSNNRIGDWFYNNGTNDDFDQNIIGNYFNSNIINANFNYNRIGENFYNNIIINEFSFNITSSYFFYNNLYGFSSNKIGINFYENTIGDNCSNNDIGDGFYNNTILSGFSNNKIGKYFTNNEIEEGFGFGAGDSQNNIIGDYFEYNSIGEYFYNNKVASYFHHNTVGYYFQRNNIDTSIYDEDFTINYGNIVAFTYTSSGTTSTDNYYVVSGNTNGNGVDSNFGVTISGGTISSLSLVSAGNQYAVGNNIIIPGNSIGGQTGVILTFSSDGIGKTGTDGSYTGVTVSGGTGSNATFDIVVSSDIISSISLADGGSSYIIGNTLSVYGSQFGGTDGADDFTITVDSLYSDDITITITEVSERPSVYETYNCQIFERKGGDRRLSYYDEEDVLTIKDINS